MYCPRLNHFVRFNPDGTVSRCGHMISQSAFANLDEMNSSDWLKKIKHSFSRDAWPKECERCRQTEEINQTSIRLNTIKQQEDLHNTDYLQVSGVLDNICNSACQSCYQGLSTKIGSLYGKTYPIVDNSKAFWNLPMEKILYLDINGGEPSASKNYKKNITKFTT